MLLLDGNPEVDSVKHLLEAGASVNAPPDPCEQSPVHLAAGGGRACFLLWQLQTGADLNQQDVFGEAPIHKAAKAGSLECLSLLVAGDAQIDAQTETKFWKCRKYKWEKEALMSCWVRRGVRIRPRADLPLSYKPWPLARQ
ncbi:ankyrin repeat domain-containing protein 37 isoform X4 [Pteronotus mesoamericanus]|nr:ankyrin repeat domain-containing protein 37 isoform X4 [Pteronotus parnellii mesoamericanus]